MSTNSQEPDISSQDKSQKAPKSPKPPKKRDFDNIPKPARPSISSGGRTIYLTNKELLAEVTKCKAEKKMSNTLAKMLQLLCSRYGKKGSFVNYSYNEDMQAYAMYMLVKTWDRFNEQLYQNAFAFYTQCIKHSFKQYLNMEKKHRTIRDMLLIDNGLNPSFNFNNTDEFTTNYDGDYDSYLDSDNFATSPSQYINDDDTTQSTEDIDLLDQGVNTDAVDPDAESV